MGNIASELLAAERASSPSSVSVSPPLLMATPAPASIPDASGDRSAPQCMIPGSVPTGVCGVSLYASMRERESDGPRKVPAWSRYRVHVVDWISKVGKGLEVHRVTSHAAIYLMDRAVARGMVPERSRVQAIATTCLVLATKYEENYDEAPDLVTVVEASEGVSVAEVVEMERDVLRCLNWDVGVRTPLHFVCTLFACVGFCFPKDTRDGKELPEKSEVVVGRGAELLATVCVRDYGLRSDVRASLAAVAVVCAARRLAHILPWWHASLETASGYSMTTVRDVVRTVETIFRKCIPGLVDMTTEDGIAAATAAFDAILTN